MLWWFSLLLLIAAMAVFVTHLRWPQPDRRRQLLIMAMLLMGASSLTQTFVMFMRAEDNRATALERVQTPGIPTVVRTWAERDLLTQPSLGLLVNAVLGGALIGAGGMALLRSRRPE